MATAEVFNGDSEKSNEHFKAVGKALGLVRIKDLCLGTIDDLKQQINEQPQQDDTTTTKS